MALAIMALTTSCRIFAQTSQALAIAFLESADPEILGTDGNAVSDISRPLAGAIKTKKPPEGRPFECDA
jgi:hypothetical protein